MQSYPSTSPSQAEIPHRFAIPVKRSRLKANIRRDNFMTLWKKIGEWPITQRGANGKITIKLYKMHCLPAASVIA